MKKLFSLILCLLGGAYLSLQALPYSEVCKKVIGSGNSRAYLTVETDSLGRVLLTLNAADGGSDALTMWRGQGLNPNGFKFNGQPASNFFTRTPSSVDRVKQIVYTPIPTATVDTGLLLTFNMNGENVYTEWFTSKDGNAYSSSVRFSYTYGAVCRQLPMPVITAISADSVPAFAAVEGASSYLVRVYRAGFLQYEQTIQPGDPIHFLPLVTTTYQVTLTAIGDNVKDSPESAPYDWALTRPDIRLGYSEYCGETFSSGSSAADITWETLPNGDVAITIGGTNAHWRSEGLGSNNLSRFTVSSMPASSYFSRQYTTNATVYTLHLKDSTVRPELGEPINFYGTVEWATQTNTNAYGTYSFRYTYGTTCPGLEVPVITSISADSAIHFSLVDGADTYLARVYNGTILKYTQQVMPGDVLHFQPLESATYTVTLTSQASGKLDSDESAPYQWTLTAPEITLGNSEYCFAAFGRGNSAAYITWETLANGDVEITLGGNEGVGFRANGMAGETLAGFTVSGQPASTYFSRQFAGDRSLTYTLHLLNDSLRPALGENIRFSGTVEWMTAESSNAYADFTFSYTYGTTCPGLEAPQIASISPEGVLSLVDTVPGAGSYTLYIYRGELLVATCPNLLPGDTVPFEPTVTYDYTVYARACSSTPGFVPSDYSEPYVWHLTVKENETTTSAVCDMLVSTDDGGVYLTAETDDEGHLVFTLSGDAQPVWRGNGLNMNAMFLGSTPIGNYFRPSGTFVGDSVLTLALTSSGVGSVFLGDLVHFSGTIEWTAKNAAGESVSRWNTDFRFDYVYGTTCQLLLPRLESPAGIEVDSLGFITFDTVPNAGSYQAKVLDADSDEMLRQVVALGDSLMREQTVLHPFAYYVSLRALPADSTLFRPSLWSAAALWTPSYIAPPTPEPDPEDDPDSPDQPNALDDIQTSRAQKVFYRGQLIILHNGRPYTLLGLRLE